MIKIRNLIFAYGKETVFSDYSLDISGDITVITGPSGSGKTTILKLIAGLAAPQAGTIEGVPKRPSFMFQENRLLPWLTARENVKSVMPGEDDGKAEEILCALELEDMGNKYPGDMSGGQQRRVALARAIAYGGDMLILDEPMKGLDEPLIRRVTTYVKSLDVPIVVTAHSEYETALWGGDIVMTK